jgi:L-alanine-DL-glutamate epimerase-like enolase superfamily enzyme
MGKSFNAKTQSREYAKDCFGKNALALPRLCGKTSGKLMRIVDVTTFRRDFKLQNPSVVAYEAIETAPNLLVRIELENGLVGWGNAAPDAHVTGETAEGVERTINQLFRPFLIGQEASRIEWLWSRLCGLVPKQPTAIAAIDIALYDLLGKAAGLPLCKLLGPARDEILTSVTLSIEETMMSVARGLDFQAQGFKALKIKCGLDAGEDIARVRSVRQAVGDAVRISLDANQGYSVETTLRVLADLRGCDIAFIEQPVAAGDIEALRELCRRSPIPVMADESVLGAADVLATPAPLVNLKLMKTGGITGALKANAVAEARGIRAMVGCMDESRISMAAAAHVALALGSVPYADLDGHLDIIEDVASEGILIAGGMVHVGAGAGLGLWVSDKLIGEEGELG